MDRRLDTLEGKLAHLQGQILALEVAPPGTAPAVGGAPGENIAEWVSGITGGSGVVVDPGLARSTRCSRVHLPEGMGSVVFSPGIVGPLDDDQVALYCAEGVDDKAVTPEQLQFLSTMHRAAQLCGIETAPVLEAKERIDAYYGCLGRELKKGTGEE